MKTTLDWFKKHEVTIVLCLGLLGIFVLPWLFTRPWIADFTNLGQVGDTIGGTTAPFIGLLSAWLVYRAFKAQIKANELISEQLKLEEQRYAEGKEKDRETAQTANFMKMYEAYVRALNGLSSVQIKQDITFRYLGNRNLPNSITTYELKGRQFIEELIFPDAHIKDTICKIDLSADIQNQTRDVKLDKAEHWYQLHPLFRVTFHLLRQELSQNGIQKWENIRFFRAQLTEPELNVLAMNALFDDEGLTGLAKVAKKTGLFKHLKSLLLVSLLKNEADSDGFFDIKITEDKYKADPVILDKK
jgi:hypothetical protein